MFQDMDAFVREKAVGMETQQGDASDTDIRNRSSQRHHLQLYDSNLLAQQSPSRRVKKHGALCTSRTIVRHSVVAALFFSQDGPLFETFIVAEACGVPSSMATERG